MNELNSYYKLLTNLNELISHSNEFTVRNNKLNRLFILTNKYMYFDLIDWSFHIIFFIISLF